MAQVKPIVHMSLKFTNYNARARLLVHLYKPKIDVGLFLIEVKNVVWFI
jgi:hypothetical protein